MPSKDPRSFGEITYDPEVHDFVIGVNDIDWVKADKLIAEIVDKGIAKVIRDMKKEE